MLCLGFRPWRKRQPVTCISLKKVDTRSRKKNRNIQLIQTKGQPYPTDHWRFTWLRCIFCISCVYIYVPTYFNTGSRSQCRASEWRQHWGEQWWSWQKGKAKPSEECHTIKGRQEPWSKESPNGRTRRRRSTQWDFTGFRVFNKKPVKGKGSDPGVRCSGNTRAQGQETPGSSMPLTGIYIIFLKHILSYFNFPSCELPQMVLLVLEHLMRHLQLLTMSPASWFHKSTSLVTWLDGFKLKTCWNWKLLRQFFHCTFS